MGERSTMEDDGPVTRSDDLRSRTPTGTNGRTSCEARRESGPRRRSWCSTATAAVAALGLAASVGGAAGWFAGQAAGPSETTTATGRPSLLTGDTLDVADVLVVAGPSVAAIHTRIYYEDEFIGRSRTEAGTGIVLSADGLVLTNAHVVEDALSIFVSLAADDDAHEAVVVEIDPSSDVAVVRIEGVAGLVPATFGDSDHARVGDDVVAVGNALNLGNTMTVTQGIISALDRSIDTDRGTLSGLLQTDAAMSSGQSGGALIDSAGSVIGMNTAVALSDRDNTAQNIGFAIASNELLEIVAGFGIVLN